MLNKLRAMYPKAMIESPDQTNDPTRYQWFQTDDHHIFGILKKALTENESCLLLMFFKPQTVPSLQESLMQKTWSNILFEGNEPNDGDLQIIGNPTIFYALLFSLKQPLDDWLTFEEALGGFFSVPYALVWKDRLEGVIIVLDSHKELHEEIVDMIASDFYTDMTIMTTPLTTMKDIHAFYSMQAELFEIARGIFPEKHDFHYEQLLPLAMIHAIPQDRRKLIFNQFANELNHEDPESIRSISVFFEHNLNLTTASKALFIHRNSLQYRIERFYEKTGLDPKKFEDAVVITSLMIHHQYEQFVQKSQESN